MTTEEYLLPVNLFDRLVEVETTGPGQSKIVPGLADKWDVSADGKVYMIDGAKERMAGKADTFDLDGARTQIPGGHLLLRAEPGDEAPGQPEYPAGHSVWHQPGAAAGEVLLQDRHTRQGRSVPVHDRRGACAAPVDRGGVCPVARPA